MKKIFEKKLLYLLTAIFLIFQTSLLIPNSAVLLGALNSLIYALALFFLLKIKPKEKHVYPIFILPVILIIEMSGALATIPSFGLQQLFIFSSCFFLYLITFSLEAIRSGIEAYAYIIYNVLVIANLISVFLGYVLFYNFYYRYSWPTWLGMLVIFIVSLALYMFSLWHNNFLNKKGYLYLLLIAFLMLEFFWIVSLWPFGPLQSGFILFLIYYSLSDIFILILKNNFTQKKIINHLTVPTIVLIFLFLSAGW